MTSPSALNLSRFWPWIEKTAPRRFAFALVVGLVAAAMHWLIYPVTQSRVPFLFFLPAVVLVTMIAGRWPAVLTAALGVANSALLKEPGKLLITDSAQQMVLVSGAVVSLLVIVASDFYRSLSRRELSDLNELHELSTTLASIPALPEQLQLILGTFVRMHGGTLGLIALRQADGEGVELAASTGIGTRDSLRELCPLCVTGERVVVENTDRDPRFEPMRRLGLLEESRAMHSTPLVGRDAAVLGALAVFVSRHRRPTERELRIADICARKASVFIERARAEELVRQRDRRFETVLESSGVPFVVLGPIRAADGQITDFRFTYANTAAAVVMRLRPVEIVGRAVLDIMPRAWDDRARFQMYVEALEHHEVREMERHTEADGNVAWYHVVASPLDGDLAVWFADISRRKHQERQLVEADRRKDEFLATLAHELRNPLAPIRQAAAIARNDAANEAQRRWAHNVIERQVQHMSLLLDDLLDVSRITHGTLQLRRQHTDVQSVVTAAVETARPLVEERHHELVVEVPDSLRVFGDPLRLAQVLSNLLTNAAKYTPPRGRIHVMATQSDGELVLRVEDNGIGIAAEDLPRVFGMFSQVRAAHEHAAGGLGIGLALARGVVELHGGRIEAASAGPGLGSVFTVRLPAAAGERPVAPAVQTTGESRPSAARRILVADDNRDAAESLAMILKLEGHDVRLAHDGEAALRAFEEYRPDVALLDIGMPKCDGYDVARRIRGVSNGRDVLLVAITGWAQEADKAQSRDAGFDCHLTKPIEPANLIELLDHRP